jgi:hypothetical protein
MKNTNETIKIKIKSPLIRPGIEISAKVSKRYANQALTDLMEIVRGFNEEQNAARKKVSAGE